MVSLILSFSQNIGPYRRYRIYNLPRKIATIVAFKDKQDLNLLKNKSVTFTHEYMYTRPLHETEDMQRHHELLSDITDKIESGKYKPTVNKVLQGLTVDNLYEALIPLL